ncbi:uncharacterized protein VNE69_04204 [Vairimorpha necatrix]|uniref:Uncharacterized protein n=1 Tax=Vairimorpha necatrix TaxID=6039 RepID=A0AAX4JBU9_9MICR
MKKFDIFLNKNIEIPPSQDLTKDISLALESSSVLRSSKYANNKTKIKFNFLKFTQLYVLKLFFITVLSSTKDGYIGFDSSCRCLIKTKEKLIINKRYEMYGKIVKEKYLTLICEKIIEIDYKKLVYQLL